MENTEFENMNHAEKIAFLNTCMDNQGWNVKVREAVEFKVMDSLDENLTAEEMKGYKSILKRIAAY